MKRDAEIAAGWAMIDLIDIDAVVDRVNEKNISLAQADGIATVFPDTSDLAVNLRWAIAERGRRTGWSVYTSNGTVWNIITALNLLQSLERWPDHMTHRIQYGEGFDALDRVLTSIYRDGVMLDPTDEH